MRLEIGEEESTLKVNRRDALKTIGGVAASLRLFPGQAFAESRMGSSTALGISSGLGLDDRRDQSFDRDWLFYLGDAAGAENPSFEDSSWRKLDLPHDWSIEDRVPTSEAEGEGTVWIGGNTPTRIGPFDVGLSAGQEATGWVVGGTGWYRKHFRVPRSSLKNQVEIRFDGIYMNSDVWLNGQVLGNHPYGYTSFAYDLTPYLRWDAENVLAVRVRNEGQNSRWYSGSGIYRHVWLTLTGDVRLPLWGISVETPHATAATATANVTIKAENRGKQSQDAIVRVKLLGPGREAAATAEQSVVLPAGGESSVSRSFEIQKPQLWSADTPRLYRAEVELSVGGQGVDRSAVDFGVRTIDVDIEHGLRINGEAVKLRGGCVHHDNGILGSAAIDRADERRVELMKQNGFNAIRCSHNPPSPAFLDACDRLGIMVIDEAFDCWNLGKNNDDYHLYFEAWWKRDMESMLLRDRNHPSIVFWSIGNEIDGRRSPQGVKIAEQLRDIVKSFDTSRPVTMAVPGPYDHNLPQWQANDPAFLHLDVGGYNYQWQQYELDHKRFPNRIMLGTESFPFEAYDSWTTADKLSYVLGDFVWTGIDYLGEAAIGHTLLSQTPAWWRQQYPWFNSYCGDIDVTGGKKPQSFYRDVLWGRSQLEVAVQRPLPPGRTEELSNWGWWDELHSWNWTGYEGKALNVRVYTLGDMVKVFLNGKQIASKPVPETAKLIAEIPVPYAQGEIKVVAFKNGSELATRSLKTTGKPAKLELRADRQEIRASRNDLAFVTIEVTDAAGSLIPDAIRTIAFEVEGSGELAAVGSANPKDATSFREPHCRTYRGKCLAILRPAGREGEITLRARSNGLTSAAITVKCTPA